MPPLRRLTQNNVESSIQPQFIASIARGIVYRADLEQPIRASFPYHQGVANSLSTQIEHVFVLHLSRAHFCKMRLGEDSFIVYGFIDEQCNPNLPMLFMAENDHGRVFPGEAVVFKYPIVQRPRISQVILDRVVYQ